MTRFPARLTIELLGPFRVTTETGAVADFETDAARALLAYLAMHQGTPFSRETLADLLWPAQPASKSLSNLRKTLSRLRNAIEDQDAGNPLIEAGRHAIQLNKNDNCWLDVTAFTDLIAVSKQHVHWRLERCLTCLSKLQTAAEMYRGDFLTGLSIDSLPFQEWLSLIREQLFSQMMGVLDRLVAHSLQRGTHDVARRWAWRQLELEPWCEEAHRQLMRSLALDGQRSAALAQYETCRQTLATQLRVEPSAETTTLFEKIRRGNLASQGSSQPGLPINLTTFIGREAELTQLVEFLQRPDCRLLTLLGLGGIGKTRLALQVALQEGWMYRDGVYFVPLSGLTSSDQVLTTLTRALQFVPDPKQDLTGQLWNYLRRKEMLLVFDSAEHVLAAARQIMELLQQAPDIQALVTSRERLHVPGEWVYEIEGLTYPQTDQPYSPVKWSAVQLFGQSARRAQPDFDAEAPAVAHICRLVEGMPLAIELAAAWVRTLSCHDIAQEIERDLGFLHSQRQGVPDHHHSLRAVFESAWAILSSEERAVLRRLSVFHSGFDRSAAITVAEASPAILAALADKSWLRQDRPGPSAAQIRYGSHELIQRYVAEQLAAEREIENHTRDQHSHYYTAWLQEREVSLKGNAQRSALQEIGFEIENVRAAWEWAGVQRRIADLELAWESLFLFYDLQSWFQEGADMFEQLAQSLKGAEPRPAQILRGRALACQARFVSRFSRHPLAQELTKQSIALLQTLDAPRDLAIALSHLGLVLLAANQYAEARDSCQASLAIFQQIGERYHTTIALNSLGQIALRQGHYPEAEQHCRASLDLARINQFSQREAESLYQLGLIFSYSGNWVEAGTYYEQALTSYQEANNSWGISTTLSALGGCFDRRGEYARAQACLEQALPIKQQIGDRRGEGIILMHLADVAGTQSNYAAAQSYLVQALNIVYESGDRRNEGRCLATLGMAALEQGDWVSAEDHLKRALAISREIPDKDNEVISLAISGNLALRQGDFTAAYDCLKQSLDACREIGNQYGMSIALASLGLLFHYSGDQETALTYNRQALHLTTQTGYRSEQARALTILGHTCVSLERWVEAMDSYQQALAIQRDLNLPRMATEPLAGLARVALDQGNSAQAQNYVTEILECFQTQALDGTEDPIRIYLTCYRVLQASQDPGAQAILATAHQFLQARAAKTSSETLRSSYLEKIPSHRELLAEWNKPSGP